MPTAVTVNSENWPVNIVTVSASGGEPIDRAATETLCRALESFAARHEPYANIIDLTACGPVPAIERQFVANAFNEHTEAYRRYLIAVAVILRSATMRGVLTAIGWIHRYPAPLEFVATFGEAEKILMRHFTRRGLPWRKLAAS